jgi:hypothetical protein
MPPGGIASTTTSPNTHFPFLGSTKITQILYFHIRAPKSVCGCIENARLEHVLKPLNFLGFQSAQNSSRILKDLEEFSRIVKNPQES